MNNNTCSFLQLVCVKISLPNLAMPFKRVIWVGVHLITVIQKTNSEQTNIIWWRNRNTLHLLHLCFLDTLPASLPFSITCSHKGPSESNLVINLSKAKLFHFLWGCWIQRDDIRQTYLFVFCCESHVSQPWWVNPDSAVWKSFQRT